MGSMKVSRRQLTFQTIWAFAVVLLMPLQARAIVLLPPCTKSGNCGVSDILIVLVNFAEFLLGVSGAVALLFFVYGGFTMLTSAGRSDQVEKGKTILRNAVIGIVIIFTSGVIVRFTTQALTGGSSRIPTVGESCNPGTQKSEASTGDPCDTDKDCTHGGEKCNKGENQKSKGECIINPGGLWVTIPAGVDPNNSTKIVPEGLRCIAKEGSKDPSAPCQDLNSVLEARGRKEKYQCLAVEGGEDKEGKYDVRGCVRGLCVGQPAGIACCIRVTP